MKKTVNNQSDGWPPEVQAVWDLVCGPKFEGETEYKCQRANYFTPRLPVDEWNRASYEAGFVYVIVPVTGFPSPIVCEARWNTKWGSDIPTPLNPFDNPPAHEGVT
jgi:hypothetical protein